MRLGVIHDIREGRSSVLAGVEHPFQPVVWEVLAGEEPSHQEKKTKQGGMNKTDEREEVLICSRTSQPWGESIHDEAHDGPEVMAVKGHLRGLGHVDVTCVPRPLGVPQAL